MLDPDAAALLSRVLAETRAGRLKWERDADDYFRAKVGTNARQLQFDGYLLRQRIR